MGNVLLNDCEIEKGNVQTDSGDMFFKNCDFDDLKVNTDMGTLCFIGKEAVMRAWNVQVDTEMGNINADDAACAIAEAVHAEKLVFLSDIEGVYKDKDDPNTLISELHVHEAEKLISEGYVGGGMIPKLQNCIDAIEEGVNRVHILDGRIPHSLLLEIFTNKGIGTAILREDGEKYYDEHE